ncbi:hypothetical protein [Flagellimonas myxillae]|uniref:hypothetical protein n=1 Tax=Flagellimonas myxillae TaxID=2942214 RepID=UPI00201FAAB8|nr:hypothetical protein [Muricauda myxillae]MCL6266291.1 hypothetical protein [Muricauda myxillae]
MLVLFVLSYVSSVGQQLRTKFGDVYYEPNFYLQKYGGPEGSPYLTKKFSPAKIEGFQKTYLVRFNAVEGTIEVLMGEKQVVVLDESKTYSVTLQDGSNRTYETHRFINSKGKTEVSFFELLDAIKGRKLYIKESKKFMKKVQAQGYADEQPAHFKTMRREFYISKNPGAPLLRIPQKMKSFISFFDHNSKAMKAYIKEHKLSIDKPDDLVKIINFHYTQHG